MTNAAVVVEEAKASSFFGGVFLGRGLYKSVTTHVRDNGSGISHHF